MPLLKKLFGKKLSVAKASAFAKDSVAIPASTKARADVKSKILLPHTTEKALNGQKFNQYVFKVSTTANKIMIANEVKRTYNVKVIGVNIINVLRKARRVGKTLGFKKGYKKAVVTLAEGQSIEIAK
ncbi:MAG: 50S ribosomal protein L23 [Candidatus Azambacteria bacterium]|nr:50S ribosomal protein L23 [Candidatus Azambacteria bacterium]